jgi:predicted Fe-Mo cluster-binding NifX family protein
MLIARAVAGPAAASRDEGREVAGLGQVREVVVGEGVRAVVVRRAGPDALQEVVRQQGADAVVVRRGHGDIVAAMWAGAHTVTA